MPLRFAHGVLSFTNSNVEYLLGKLDGIARTFGHEASIPYQPVHGAKIETETPPLKAEDLRYR